MTNICETLGNNQRNYYYDTQPYIYNQSYSINSNVIHPNLYNGSEIFYNNDKNISTENITYKNNYTNTNINMKATNNFRNKMNISKIIKKKLKKPQLTQEIANNFNHKKTFNSLKREKSLDVLTIKKNLLLNKNFIKKNAPKKLKKEKDEQIEKILSKKLNKKLNNINEEIEDKIYKSILKPTLRELEKNLQNNFESIKEKLRSHSVNFSHPNIKTTKSNRPMKTNIEINNEKNNTYKRSNLDEENNSIETENIKKNIVEKQQQLNELLFKLNNKQNQSLNHFISFRKDK
jgi:hypothetical protein